MDKDYIGYKFKLYPTPEQEQIFKEYFGVCRFVYNLGISLQEKNRKEYLLGKTDVSTLTFISLDKKLSKIKRTNKYEWLNKYSTSSLTCIMRDVAKAYKNYFNGLCRKPKYKKKKAWANQSFPVRPDRMIVRKDTVRLSSIGDVYIGNHGYDECIGNGREAAIYDGYKHYYNSRVVFDGCNYYLTFSLLKSEINQPNSCKRFKNNEVWQHKKCSEPLGIDINAHYDTWIVLSDGKVFKRPDTRKEDKCLARDHRRLINKMRINKEKKTNSTVVDTKLKEPIYTKNEIKLLKKINKKYNKKSNKKRAVIHECGCYILDKKPEYLVMETLSVDDMFMKPSDDIRYKHRIHHNNMITESIIYTVQNMLETKLISNDIPVYYADSSYPSSQLCSCCGYRQKIGINRIYKCPVCGNVMDRDLNAAKNISNYFNYNENIIEVS